MKKKIFFSVLLVFILFFIALFTNVSHASFTVTDNTNNTNNPQTYTFADIPDAYIDYFNRGYLIRQYNGVFYFVLYRENTLCYAKNGVMDIKNIVYLSYDKNTQKYDLKSNNTSANGDVADYIYYNGDIYTDENKSDYFFQKPPLLPVVTQAVVKVGALEMKQVTKEILAILPVILSVLVSLLAFSKGLSLLLSFLRKS